MLVVLSLLISISLVSVNSVIENVSQMLKTPVPRIEVEILPQKKMQEIYREEIFKDCMNSGGGFPACVDYSKAQRVFVYGMWIKEKDPKHFHIRLTEGYGINVVVHEYLHWWLNNIHEDLNREETVDVMVKTIMTSPDFKGGVP